MTNRRDFLTALLALPLVPKSLRRALASDEKGAPVKTKAVRRRTETAKPPLATESSGVANVVEWSVRDTIHGGNLRRELRWTAQLDGALFEEMNAAFLSCRRVRGSRMTQILAPALNASDAKDSNWRIASDVNDTNWRIEEIELSDFDLATFTVVAIGTP